MFVCKMEKITDSVVQDSYKEGVRESERAWHRREQAHLLEGTGALDGGWSW